MAKNGWQRDEVAPQVRLKIESVAYYAEVHRKAGIPAIATSKTLSIYWCDKQSCRISQTLNAKSHRNVSKELVFYPDLRYNYLIPYRNH